MTRSGTTTLITESRGRVSGSEPQPLGHGGPSCGTLVPEQWYPQTSRLLYEQEVKGSLFLRLRGSLHERPMASGKAKLKVGGFILLAPRWGVA